MKTYVIPALLLNGWSGPEYPGAGPNTGLMRMRLSDVDSEAGVVTLSGGGLTAEQFDEQLGAFVVPI